MAEVALLDAYGRPVETRAATASSMVDWLNRTYGQGQATTSGEHVSAHSAMMVMTFFACVRNISEDMAKLPKKVRQKNGRIHTDLPQHPLSKLMRRPNPETDAHTFWATLFSHACTFPGGYAEIIRDGAGRPVEWYNLDPASIRVARSQRTGRIMYNIQGMPSNQALPQSSIIHLHGLGYDAISGYSMPQLASQIIGTALAIQKYTGSFFGNGCAPSGVLSHPAILGDMAAQSLQKRFQERYSGAANAHSILLIEEGMEWKQISTNPEDAQATELTNSTVIDVCRIFRMPPHKVQHLENAHYANIEQDNILYATDTLDGWRDRLKSELEFKMLTNEEMDSGVYIDIDLKALMRGDTAARTSFYKELFYMGAVSANDILELEDENPVENGDRRFMQANLIPTDRVDDVIDKQTESAAPDQTQQQGVGDQVREAFRLVFENKISGILRVEAGKAKQKKADSKFYAEHSIYVRNCMTEVVQAANLALGFDFDHQPICDWYSSIHCDRSQSDISVNEFTTWQDGTRARLAASAIMEKLCNSVA